jgi:hypothetical protein
MAAPRPAGPAGAPPRSPAGDVGRRVLSATPAGRALAGAVVLAVLVAAVGARFDGNGVTLVMGGALALAALVGLDAAAAWRALPRRPLAVRFPTEGVAREPVTGEISVPGWRRPVGVWLTWPDGGPPTAVTMTGGGPAVGALTIPRSGVYAGVGLAVTSTGPLGLVTGSTVHRVPLAVPLTVAPARRRHPIDWPPPAVDALPADTRRVRGDDLFKGVRDYVRGDARRLVHWPATAHRGSLMVRETEGTGTPTVRVAVSFATSGPLADAALARAAWAVADARARGWEVRLVTRAPVGPAADGPPPVGQLLRPRRSGWISDARYGSRWRHLGDPHDATVGPDGAGSRPAGGTDTDGARSRPVERPVPTEREARRRLAAARPGPLDGALRRDGVPTRWITPEGDRWQ